MLAADRDGFVARHEPVGRRRSTPRPRSCAGWSTSWASSGCASGSPTSTGCCTARPSPARRCRPRSASGVTVPSSLLLKDTVGPVRRAGLHGRHRARGRRVRRRGRHRAGARPDDVPGAAVGAGHRVAAVRRALPRRPAGAVLHPEPAARRAGPARRARVRADRRRGAGVPRLRRARPRRRPGPAHARAGSCCTRRASTGYDDARAHAAPRAHRPRPAAALDRAGVRAEPVRDHPAGRATRTAAADDVVLCPRARSGSCAAAPGCHATFMSPAGGQRVGEHRLAPAPVAAGRRPGGRHSRRRTGRVALADRPALARRPPRARGAPPPSFTTPDRQRLQAVPAATRSRRTGSAGASTTRAP